MESSHYAGYTKHWCVHPGTAGAILQRQLLTTSYDDQLLTWLSLERRNAAPPCSLM